MATKKGEQPQKERELAPNEVVIAPDTNREMILTVNRPVGRKGRRAMARHFDKIALLAELDTENQFAAVIKVCQELFKDESFEDEFLPLIFGMPIAQLEAFDILEVFRAFAEAVGFIMNPQDGEVMKAAQKN